MIKITVENLKQFILIDENLKYTYEEFKTLLDFQKKSIKRSLIDSCSSIKDNKFYFIHNNETYIFELLEQEINIIVIKSKTGEEISNKMFTFNDYLKEFIKTKSFDDYVKLLKDGAI